MKSVIFKLLAICFFCATSAHGQKMSSLPSPAPKSEISIHAGGGLSTLNYRLSQGKQSQGFGGNFGVDYTFFLGKHFGIATGAGVSLCNASVRLDGVLSRIPELIDEDGDQYELRTSFINYTERQQAIFFRIPIMVHFRTTGRISFYAQAGAVLNIPVSSRYEVNNATLSNTAYYPLYDVSLTSPSFMGLGDFPDRNTRDKLSLKTIVSASAEVGVRWQLKNPAWAFYTGVYADYGLNDALKGGRDKEILRQNAATPDEFTTNSVLSSRHAPQSSFTGKVSLMSVGLKVWISFGLLHSGNRQQAAEADVALEAQRQHEAAEIQRRQVAEAQRQQEIAEVQQQREAAEAEVARQQAIAEQQEIAEAQQQREAVEAQRQHEAAETEVRFATLKQEVESPIEGFRPNQTSLTDEQKSALAQKIALLKEYPDLHVVCEGHTCDLGSEEVNLRVGKLRAEVAKKYLVEQGIAENRISIVSKGFKEPLVQGTDEASRVKNRRIVIKIEN
ncbi:MAG: OmpA family protein [Bacteroidales bacterium]|jgi:outer membrane protein OmpA-like peptidoglycan-associated protein|nr:OmpA family protein [Bacteroidales bacterium]